MCTERTGLARILHSSDPKICKCVYVPIVYELCWLSGARSRARERIVKKTYPYIGLGTLIHAYCKISKHSREIIYIYI